MEITVPLLPCPSLEETLDFYRALGFEVTHEQAEPYLYAAVRQGAFELHFSRLSAYGAKNAFGACLVLVPNVEAYHRRFADGLRARYGRIPTADLPRLTRLRKGHTRFRLFDPSGNMLNYINKNEPEGSYSDYDETLSDLARALDNAVFLRDTYSNDRAAAKVLDAALTQHDGTPIDRARALAARAELAVALGEEERAETARAELQQIALSAEERDHFHEELEAADDLERWLTTD